MFIPETACWALKKLTEAGFEAYVVGGCVRDTLLGAEPGDWDICTSALPEETERVFQGSRVIETGLKHGTVTVLHDGEPLEITTFRRDGDYLNHRTPKQVEFVSSLREDLLRRDFTVNAMAAGSDGEILDFFGGAEDLENKVIRCVGDPEQRFREDALRILRGLRFASRLGFSIEESTAGAMERCKDLLKSVSGERIYKELSGLLVGQNAPSVLEQYGSVLTPVLPEIVPAMGFCQQNPHHHRDVWGHTIEAISYSRPEPRIRWALLLHDLGKPDCFTVDSGGIGHFYGHPLRSEELAGEIFARLHVDRATTEAVCALVRHHDEGANPDRKTVRRWIGKFGGELLLELMEVKRADVLAHVETEKSRARYDRVLEFTALTKQVLQEEQCFGVKDLAIGGREVLGAGVPAGPAVGETLDKLLEVVLEDRIPNTPEALTGYLTELLEAQKGIDHAD